MDENWLLVILGGTVSGGPKLVERPLYGGNIP